MAFVLPDYHPPDFSLPQFTEAPIVTFRRVTREGVAPDGFHATSIFPEYLQLGSGDWRLLHESRMDCTVVLEGGRDLSVKEFRRLVPGDLVACGRKENGEEGIFVHTGGFRFPSRSMEKFAFRGRLTRETSFSIDYDELYGLLRYERENGFILWVLGPAVVFDRDSRESFVKLIDQGYVHGLHAGNALAVHDIEAALFGTALGQAIYSKRSTHLGHYNHLDAINRINAIGSLKEAVDLGHVAHGIMRGRDLTLHPLCPCRLHQGRRTLTRRRPRRVPRPGRDARPRPQGDDRRRPGDPASRHRHGEPPAVVPGDGRRGEARLLLQRRYVRVRRG